jgi:hypothetical protein
VDILFLTQALNAILLLPLLPLVYGISRDADLMGEYATGPREALVTLAAIGVVALAVGTLAAVSLLG